MPPIRPHCHRRVRKAVSHGASPSRQAQPLARFLRPPTDAPTLSLARILAALAALLACWLPARAETNYSDLWWNPQESGWGVGLQRQDDVLFVTLFVYGADGRNTWFVAPDVRPAQAGSSTWRGPLYRASGPGFATQYDTAVQAVEAGTATLEFDGPNEATLSYSVDGAQVSKRITRMTWREPSAAGRFHGGFSTQVRECADTTRVGAYDFLGRLQVTQNGRQFTASISSSVTGLESTCNFAGTATYSGRTASWSGTFACNIVIGLDGRGENVATTSRRGTFTVSGLAITSNGLHGALSAADQDCAFTGTFGGTRLP